MFSQSHLDMEDLFYLKKASKKKNKRRLPCDVDEAAQTFSVSFAINPALKSRQIRWKGDHLGVLIYRH